MCELYIVFKLSMCSLLLPNLRLYRLCLLGCLTSVSPDGCLDRLGCIVFLLASKLHIVTNPCTSIMYQKCGSVAMNVPARYVCIWHTSGSNNEANDAACNFLDTDISPISAVNISS